MGAYDEYGYEDEYGAEMNADPYMMNMMMSEGGMLPPDQMMMDPNLLGAMFGQLASNPQV
jgi:hypothetical protein